VTNAAFPPTRDAALARLASFAPNAGRAYAQGRNVDNGPSAENAVSKMSPYLRYRLVSEQEVVAQILRQHSFADAEKLCAGGRVANLLEGLAGNAAFGVDAICPRAR